MDRAIFSRRDLSDGAKVLYGYLCGLRNGANFTDPYMQTALQISQVVLSRRKKELKAAGLILVEQLGPRVYVVYIGHSKMSAEMVKASWTYEDAVVLSTDSPESDV